MTATGGKFMQWFGGGKMEMVPTVANRFLEMMSRDHGRLAAARAGGDRRGRAREARRRSPGPRVLHGQEVRARSTSRCNVLPGVAAKAQLIAREDRTAIEIPVDAFAP